VTISINPIIARLGPFQIGWYGVVMALAVAAGTVLFSRELGRRGISPSHALGIAVIAVPCGAIGARVVHIFDHLGYYLDHPSQIVGTRLIGLAIYGVVLGGLVGLVIYCRWKRLPILRVIDSTALAFPVGQIIGKFANIINGDTWGYPTQLPWGITYTNPAAYLPDNLLGVPTHPTPVYEQIWLLMVVGILLYAIPRLKIDGLAILLYFWLYSIGRFFISFYRVNDPWLWGLREAQVIALAVIVLTPLIAYVLVWRQKQRGLDRLRLTHRRRRPTT
jgi:phosphatidylglycerol:prolipoprotein diacylglycerol transferase